MSDDTLLAWTVFLFLIHLATQDYAYLSGLSEKVQPYRSPQLLSHMSVHSSLLPQCCDLRLGHHRVSPSLSDPRRSHYPHRHRALRSLPHPQESSAVQQVRLLLCLLSFSFFSHPLPARRPISSLPGPSPSLPPSCSPPSPPHWPSSTSSAFSSPPLSPQPGSFTSSSIRSSLSVLTHHL